MICVVGWGSPHGDDRMAWAAIEALRAVLPDRPWLSLVACDRAGPSVIEAWKTCAAVILIDAVRSDAPPGTVHRFDARDLVARARELSSHRVGMCESVALARALNLLPSVAVVYGMEISSGDYGDLSPVARAALPELIGRLVNEVRAAAKAVSIQDVTDGFANSTS